jgi:hypothetical protein
MVGNLSCLGNEPLSRRVLTYGLSKDLASLTQALRGPASVLARPGGASRLLGDTKIKILASWTWPPLAAICVSASGMPLQAQLPARETCQQSPLRVMARLVAF